MNLFLLVHGCGNERKTKTSSAWITGLIPATSLVILKVHKAMDLGFLGKSTSSYPPALLS